MTKRENRCVKCLALIFRFICASSAGGILLLLIAFDFSQSFFFVCIFILGRHCASVTDDAISEEGESRTE
jgi:hypothetical protein